jgi:hypothetical protein
MAMSAPAPIGFAASAVVLAVFCLGDVGIDI